MGAVTGIGGVFPRSGDPDALGEWYRERRTVWSLFPSDTECFGDREVPFSVDYRVDELAFLFDEATWRAEECFIDADGSADPASGMTEVRHGPDICTIEGEMAVESDDIGGPIRNLYRVRPFTGEDSATSWTSDNPRLGRLEGTFSVVADSIVSVYGSEEGETRGPECLRRVDPHTYEARGTLTIADERVTSWALTLKRVEFPERSSETGDSKAETRTTRRSRNE